MAQAVIQRERLSVKQRREHAAQEGERIVRELTKSVPASQLDQLVAVLEALSQEFTSKKAKPQPNGARESILARVRSNRTYTPEDAARLEASNVERAFEARTQVLEGALSVSEVMALLGSKTRQTPHDRLKAGSLLGVMDQGQWKFPVWQFDSEGPNGIIAGLPAVLQALGSHATVSPMQKARFLTSPSPYLNGRTPLEALKQGNVDDVVAIARGAGVS